MNKVGEVLIAAVASYAVYKLFEHHQSNNPQVQLIPYSPIVLNPGNGPMTQPTTPSSPVSEPKPSPAPVTPSTGQLVILAWGAKVSQTFRNRVVWISRELNTDVNWLMAVMAFESGETFSPSIQNVGGNHYYGLIQFGAGAASAVGTTLDALRSMSASDQLNYVYKYFLQYKGRLQSLADVYMAVLWPSAAGKPADYVLYRSPSNNYTQNKGLDKSKKGYVTKADATAAVSGKLIKGMLPGFVWTGTVNPT